MPNRVGNDRRSVQQMQAIPGGRKVRRKKTEGSPPSSLPPVSANGVSALLSRLGNGASAVAKFLLVPYLAIFSAPYLGAAAVRPGRSGLNGTLGGGRALLDASGSPVGGAVIGASRSVELTARFGMGAAVACEFDGMLNGVSRLAAGSKRRGSQPWHYNGAAGCGTCVEIAYNGQKQKAVIVDSCYQSGQGSCIEDQLDLDPSARGALFPANNDNPQVTVTPVKCNWRRPPEYVVKPATPGQVKLRVEYHDLPINKVELAGADGVWHALARPSKPDDQFNAPENAFEGAAPPNGQVQVRLTALDGSTVIDKIQWGGSTGRLVGQTNFGG